MFGMKGKTVIPIIFLLFNSTLAMAEVYRWTDEHGRVQFGDRPVTDSASEVQIKQPKTKVPAKDAVDRKQKANQFLRARELDRIEKQQKQQQAQREEAKRQQNCKKAKLELRKLQQARLLYTKDKSGKKHYITDAERAVEEKKTLKIVEHWCG